MLNRDPGTYLYGEIFSTAVLSEGEGPPTPADVWAAFGITDPNSKPPTDPPRGSGEEDPPQDPPKDPPQDPPKDPQDPPQDPPKDPPEDSNKDPDKDPNKDLRILRKDPPPNNKAAAEFARCIENKSCLRCWDGRRSSESRISQIPKKCCKLCRRKFFKLRPRQPEFLKIF